MKECPNQQKNRETCNCTYEPCPRKGICCECVSYHRASGELPACYFTPEVERTYDRPLRTEFVHFNPFTLNLEVHRAELPEPDGSTSPRTAAAARTSPARGAGARGRRTWPGR